jgi:hypothetical protein
MTGKGIPERDNKTDLTVLKTDSILKSSISRYRLGAINTGETPPDNLPNLCSLLSRIIITHLLLLLLDCHHQTFPLATTLTPHISKTLPHHNWQRQKKQNSKTGIETRSNKKRTKTRKQDRENMKKVYVFLATSKTYQEMELSPLHWQSHRQKKWK